GCYPGGVDDLAGQIAADISGSMMLSRADPHVMRLKYAKLLSSLGNAIEAITNERRGSGAYDELAKQLRAEGIACFEAAGIAYMPEPEYRRHISAHYRPTPVPGFERVGASTWQSMMRGRTT